jgi:hypothetical protein
MATVITGRDDEFRATIAALYRQELGRDPDPGGLASFLDQARHGMTGDQIRQALHDSDEAKAFRTRPKAPPRVHVEGLNFVAEDGGKWIWAMVTGFRDYERFLRGEDIRPILQETRELGGNGRRVFGAFDFGSPQTQRLYPREHPDYFDRLPEFFALNAEFGLYVQFTAFADTQRSVPGAQAQRDHWAALCDTLRPIPNVLLERVNEEDAHDNRLDTDLPKPAGITASFGSNGAGSDPPGPFWDYADLHSERRGDFALSTTTVHFAINGFAGEHGAAGFGGTHRATVVSEPPGFADTLQPGRRTNDPRIAYLMGVGCRWGAGGTAHCDSGVMSVPLTPTQRACVEQFLKGVMV